MIWIYLAIFGVLGVWLRYAIDIWTSPYWGSLGALLLANLLGTLIAGFVVWRQPSTPLNTALIVGFCGGLTTFSALVYQMTKLSLDQGSLWGILYGLGTGFLGVMALGAGTLLGHWLRL